VTCRDVARQYLSTDDGRECCRPALYYQYGAY
jgi:hypothetical protein